MSYTLNKIYSDYTNVHSVCREVLDVSDQADIDAVLIGGSLLGVVRDGDFLPWDKDLDFAVFEADIEKTLALEEEYRKLGYECRVHHLGVRSNDELLIGQQLIHDLAESLQQASIEHCVIGGALLNLYRDEHLFPEIDTLGFVLKATSDLSQLDVILGAFGKLYYNYDDQQLKGITLVTQLWRVNFFIEIEIQDQFGWRDLNCEHWFNQSFFPAQKLQAKGMSYFAPAKVQQFLSSRFGNNWSLKPQPNFSKGRVVGSMQLYKDEVMFDFIMHYVRGDNTYWFEPAANMISTLGFIPYSEQSTTAGSMLIPEHPEIFLQQHYGDWQTPVKTWNGAVDNPTIISSELAMNKIVAGVK